MSIKKTQLKITIEQKQTWRVSQTDSIDSPNSWQTNNFDAVKTVKGVEIAPLEIHKQGWSLKILYAFARMFEYVFRFLNRK